MHHAQCLKSLNCRCKHNKTFFPKFYFTFLCNETTSKFILKQLDYSPSFSTSDSQLGCASLTMCSYKTRARSLIVKDHFFFLLFSLLYFLWQINKLKLKLKQRCSTLQLVTVLTKAAPALFIKWCGEYFLK